MEVLIEVVLTAIACLAAAVLLPAVWRQRRDDPERRSRWHVEFVATGEGWTTMAQYSRAEIEALGEYGPLRVLGRAD